MATIKFGTDGWRGIIAEDFTFSNARIVAQAIARYVVRGEYARKGVLIGYDHRFASNEIATSAPPAHPFGSRTSLAPPLRFHFSSANAAPPAAS